MKMDAVITLTAQGVMLCTPKLNSTCSQMENERLELVHHISTLLTDGKLHLAPIGETPGHILDVGTGTGIWAIEMASQNQGDGLNSKISTSVATLTMGRSRKTTIFTNGAGSSQIPCAIGDVSPSLGQAWGPG
ncbi:hypothetical protein GP486_004380 [Trichoglossum hirsutum]|uniref:Methyltransferase domain-containing protein n=1 Tax=Trichoglossum hirsutum TaxID=265104 RepID=A0A9P8RPU0_9PEZI|nr:hypothetical protein GP486_004380 [Trichoglossum hirsutum]